MAMPIGAAMFFVLSLVAGVIIGLIVVTYASNTFLNALNGTAAGNDDIPWSTDPYIDRLADPFFLAYLLALVSVAVLVPVGLLFPDFVEHRAGLALVLACIVWLLFPILLLSALTGTSRWYVLHWEFLRRLVRQPLATLLFYLSTGTNLAIGGAAILFAVRFPNPLALLAVFVAAACVLIHARLCGRFAWIVGQTPIVEKSARRPRLRGVKASDPWETPDVPDRRLDPASPRQQETAVTAANPRAIAKEAVGVPDSDEDEWAPNKRPYALLEDAADPSPTTKEPASVPVAPSEEEDEWTPNKKPYAFSSDAAAHAPAEMEANNPYREAITKSPRTRAGHEEGEENTPTRPAGQFEHELPQPDRIEMRWQEGRKLPPMPRFPLLVGIWDFPFYSSTLSRFVMLSILSLFMAAMVRLLLSLAQGEIAGAL
jgi:hypothetical protein